MTGPLVVPCALDPGVDPPAYARPGDAGLDLRAAEPCRLYAGCRAIVRTGVRVAIPEGYAGFVTPRSGLALNHGITVLNAPGLIDSGYRGEVGVLLLNTNLDGCFQVEAGDRVAQLVVVPVATVEVWAVDELPETVRGAGGFGSSGR
jgi:dUTP pyrophosphatase